MRERVEDLAAGVGPVGAAQQDPEQALVALDESPQRAVGIVMVTCLCGTASAISSPTRGASRSVADSLPTGAPHDRGSAAPHDSSGGDGHASGREGLRHLATLVSVSRRDPADEVQLNVSQAVYTGRVGRTDATSFAADQSATGSSSTCSSTRRARSSRC